MRGLKILLLLFSVLLAVSVVEYLVALSGLGGSIWAEAAGRALAVSFIGFCFVFYCRWATARFLSGEKLFEFHPYTLLWGKRDTQIAKALGVMAVPFLYLYSAVGATFVLFELLTMVL